MTLSVHELHDTVDHEHLSTYVRANDGNDVLWLMMVTCQDGRCFLEAEFDDDEFLQFPDVYMKSQGRNVVFFAGRHAALCRALEIANVLRPTAGKERLLDEISAAATTD